MSSTLYPDAYELVNAEREPVILWLDAFFGNNRKSPVYRIPSSQNIGTIPKLFGNAVLKTSPNVNLGRHELLFDERSSREIGNPAACAHCDH